MTNPWLRRCPISDGDAYDRLCKITAKKKETNSPRESLNDRVLGVEEAVVEINELRVFSNQNGHPPNQNAIEIAIARANEIVRKASAAFRNNQPRNRNDLYAFVSRAESKDCENVFYLEDDEDDVPFAPLPVPQQQSEENNIVEISQADEPALELPRVRVSLHDNLNEEVLNGESFSMNGSDLQFLPGTKYGNLRFGGSLLGPETGLGVFNVNEIGEYEAICEHGENHD